MKIKLPKVLESAVLSVIGYEEIDDEEDETEEPENIVGGKITPKMLKDIEDDWVKSYIIN